MKNNKNNISSLKIEIDKKALGLSLIVSLLLFGYIFFKYGLMELINLLKGRAYYSTREMISLIIAYVICVIFVVSIVNSVRMLLNKEPMLFLNKDGIMVNSTLGKEFHGWNEFKSYRIVKKGRKYAFYLESINKKEFIKKKNFAKRIVFIISYLFGGYGVECNFTVSAMDATMVENILNKHVQFDKKGFKRLIKSAKVS